MFIFNYKKYEFKLQISNDYNILMNIYKNTLTDKIPKTKIIIGELKLLNIQNIPENLDLNIEENEKKFLTYIGSKICNFIVDLLKNNKAYSEFKLEKNKVKIIASMEGNNYNILMKIDSNNPKTGFALSVTENKLVNIKVDSYNKLLADFSKEGDLVKFEQSINADFGNSIQQLFRYVYNLKKEINEKKIKEEQLNLVSSEYEETKNEKLKLNEQIDFLNIKIQNNEKQIKNLKGEMILYKIGSGLSIIFFIVIIVLFFRRRKL
jgi:hypothetical protein